jgi:hypothetical protein
MSDDNGQPAQFNWQDAFTSPSWQIPELDEAVLAPPLEDFGLTDFRAPRNLPRPPDVDEILRGEYTGWVPVIREGESLEQAQERQQAVAAPQEVLYADETVQVIQHVERVSDAHGVEPMEEPDSYSPWLAVETFEYGLHAQHEVPAPPQPTPVVQPVVHVEPTPVAQPMVHVQPEPVAQPEPVRVAPEPQPDAFNDTFDTSTWSGSDPASGQSQSRPTQSIDTNLVSESVSSADHSLELVIMRDEIQDLRNRLDASQKLVEEMMHKLSNLAELALRSRM